MPKSGALKFPAALRLIGDFVAQQERFRNTLAGYFQAISCKPRSVDRESSRHDVNMRPAVRIV
jgi:hypothetical protein